MMGHAQKLSSSQGMSCPEAFLPTSNVKHGFMLALCESNFKSVGDLYQEDVLCAQPHTEEAL